MKRRKQKQNEKRIKEEEEKENELVKEYVDESDPDFVESQIEHLLQSAEAIRRDYPAED